VAALCSIYRNGGGELLVGFAQSPTKLKQNQNTHLKHRKTKPKL
jgi:hypothetical protein